MTSDAMPAALLTALRDSGATLLPALTEAELLRIEASFGFVFAPDHRLMLSLALPLGDRFWPDWRGADETDLRERLAWPHIGGRVHAGGGLDLHGRGQVAALEGSPLGDATMSPCARAGDHGPARAVFTCRSQESNPRPRC